MRTGRLMSCWYALLCSVVGAAMLAFPVIASVRDWRLDTPERVLDGTAIRETVWTQARPPDGTWDRIRVHRYRGVDAPFAALLYLPGTNMNGAAALDDEAHNLWLYLAARGVDVFTLDYRTHAIPADTAPDQLAALQAWDTATFVDDIDAAAGWVRSQNGGVPLSLAGFSRGAFLAWAHALRHADGLAGLIALDGAFKSPEPTGQYDTAAAVRQLHESRRWASDVGGSRGWDARRQLMAAVMADPSAPAPDADDASIGELLVRILHTAWGEGALARRGVSNPQVLAMLLHGYDRYYPAIQDIESRAIADHADDPNSTLDDGWGRLTLPILAVASTGMGAAWTNAVLHSAHSSGSTDVETRVLDGYGHLDVLVGERARIDVYQPLLEWLCTRNGGCTFGEK